MVYRGLIRAGTRDFFRIGRRRGAQRRPPAGTARWDPLTRVAFRFCVVYFGVFCLVFVQIMFVWTGALGSVLPPGVAVWQMSALGPLTEWVGRHVFGVDAALRPDSRSGAQTCRTCRVRVTKNP